MRLRGENTLAINQPMAPCYRRKSIEYSKEDVLLRTFGWFISENGVDDEVVRALCLVSHRMYELVNRRGLWQRAPWADPVSGKLTWIRFKYKGKKGEGTEGVCYKCCDRATGKYLALKKARVYPHNEGVPYYMLRELAALKDICHPNIAALRCVNLHESKLFLLFDYFEYTLHNVLSTDTDGHYDVKIGVAEPIAKSILRQLLEAVAYCHSHGILHRNIKPKHLLISTPNNEPPNKHTLSQAHILLSDFALVRLMSHPRREYTSEVVTLWYRPPEILMGERCYTEQVDVWSIGCVLGELLCGCPLFTGISEIDQLFQVFRMLGTPNKATAQPWPGFENLPNYNPDLFPTWTAGSIHKQFHMLDGLGVDLLLRLFALDPRRRISAHAALRHPYFLYDEEIPRISCQSAISSALRTPVTIRDTFPSGCDEATAHFGNFLYTAKGAHAMPWNLVKQESSQSCCYQLVECESGVQEDHRSLLVDWLVEVVDVFDISLRTLFLGVAYMDWYLRTSRSHRKQFQLIGATCLHIASKVEDVSYIGVDDLALCLGRIYEPKDILKMEETVLNNLQFQMVIPTTLDFIHITFQMIPSLVTAAEGRLWFLCLFLAELSLQELKFVQALPTHIAGACFALGLWQCGLQPWSRDLSLALRCSLADVHSEAVSLHKCQLSSPNTSLCQVVYERYMKDERMTVARDCPRALTIDFDAS